MFFKKGKRLRPFLDDRKKCPPFFSSIYRKFIFNFFISATHGRPLCQGKSLVPITMITDLSFIFLRSVMLFGAADARGANADHFSRYFIPYCHLPPPPTKWPIKKILPQPPEIPFEWWPPRSVHLFHSTHQGFLERINLSFAPFCHTIPYCFSPPVP